MGINEKDSPGVIAPPPLIYFCGLALGGIIHWFFPRHIFPAEFGAMTKIAGALLIVAGLGLILIARSKMQKAQTNIEPWKPTKAIISDGIYSVSRNPIYAAMIIIYFGATLIVNSVWFVPFLPVVILAMHYGVILREEKYLERKFGDEYLAYKNRVRRWI
ncbi:MAG: isoprenylcysteine carboxylmethyltransferase family protein [Pyrinomonadaceae bacterium]|nr:isoprenylcysteine carboxylmethyltransferase family protein [Pyrinomonadaceae bacterium]